MAAEPNAGRQFLVKSNRFICKSPHEFSTKSRKRHTRIAAADGISCAILRLFTVCASRSVWVWRVWRWRVLKYFRWSAVRNILMSGSYSTPTPLEGIDSIFRFNHSNWAVRSHVGCGQEAGNKGNLQASQSYAIDMHYENANLKVSLWVGVSMCSEAKWPLAHCGRWRRSTDPHQINNRRPPTMSVWAILPSGNGHDKNNSAIVRLPRSVNCKFHGFDFRLIEFSFWRSTRFPFEISASARECAGGGAHAYMTFKMDEYIAIGRPNVAHIKRRRETNQSAYEQPKCALASHANSCKHNYVWCMQMHVIKGANSIHSFVFFFFTYLYILWWRCRRFFRASIFIRDRNFRFLSLLMWTVFDWDDWRGAHKVAGIC